MAALRPQRRSELATALARCRQALIGVGAFTAAVNLLQLVGPFFMLEVYDRVIPGRSIPTLVAISVLALVMFAFAGLLDMLRSRVLARIAGLVDGELSGRVYDVASRLPLRTAVQAGAQPLIDLDRIRGFLSSMGPAAFFDLPWMPIYIAICFLFHPLIGMVALAGALLLVAIAVATELRLRQPTRELLGHGERRRALAESSRRNAEVIQAMGLGGRLRRRWEAGNREHQQTQQRVADVVGGMSTLSRTLRMILQSAVLGVGAWLVINQQATAGIIIASSILTSRALAPVEQAVAHWRGFIAARQSWRRLDSLLLNLPEETPQMALPPPASSLTLDAVAVAPPGTTRLVVQGVAFQLKAGQGLGVVGPSASGKSSLVRAIVGVWPTLQGRIRLDGAALDQWPSDALGPHIGYLPQDTELFAGSVAENIARFHDDAPADAVIAAARAAGVHELVLALPQGYETPVGEAGVALSAGQRQRIGLARALYGDPFLVVLDEPNSNLDREGDEALTRAILGVRQRNGIVIVVAHRPSGLAGVDHVLIMMAGRQQAFGPKEQVLREAPAAPRPRIVEPVALRGARGPEEGAS